MCTWLYDSVANKHWCANCGLPPLQRRSEFSVRKLHLLGGELVCQFKTWSNQESGYIVILGAPMFGMFGNLLHNVRCLTVRFSLPNLALAQSISPQYWRPSSFTREPPHKWLENTSPPSPTKGCPPHPPLKFTTQKLGAPNETFAQEKRASWQAPSVSG